MNHFQFSFHPLKLGKIKMAEATVVLGTIDDLVKKNGKVLKETYFVFGAEFVKDVEIAKLKSICADMEKELPTKHTRGQLEHFCSQYDLELRPGKKSTASFTVKFKCNDKKYEFRHVREYNLQIIARKTLILEMENGTTFRAGRDKCIATIRMVSFCCSDMGGSNDYTRKYFLDSILLLWQFAREVTDITQKFHVENDVGPMICVLKRKFPTTKDMWKNMFPLRNRVVSDRDSVKAMFGWYKPSTESKPEEGDPK